MAVPTLKGLNQEPNEISMKFQREDDDQHAERIHLEYNMTLKYGNLVWTLNSYSLKKLYLLADWVSRSNGKCGLGEDGQNSCF
jgi:hypothetical protein